MRNYDIRLNEKAWEEKKESGHKFESVYFTQPQAKKEKERRIKERERRTHSLINQCLI